jgi:hypothetical protein
MTELFQHLHDHHSDEYLVIQDKTDKLISLPQPELLKAAIISVSLGLSARHEILWAP